MSVSFRGIGIPRDVRFASQHLERTAPAASSNAHERLPRQTTYDFGKTGRGAGCLPKAGLIHRCNSSIDRCRIWLGQRMPRALGTTMALDFTPEVERPKAARSICPTI